MAVPVGIAVREPSAKILVQQKCRRGSRAMLIGGVIAGALVRYLAKTVGAAIFTGEDDNLQDANRSSLQLPRKIEPDLFLVRAFFVLLGCRSVG